MGPERICGFKGISVKFREESAVLHWLYVKQHSVREQIPEKPPDRTLFVINVPPYCNAQCFKGIFEDYGKVIDVYFHQNPTSGLPPAETSFKEYPSINSYKVAYVIFETSEDLMQVLRLDTKRPLLLKQSDDLLCGINKWCGEYNSNIIEPELLQNEINDFIKQFDEEEKKKELREKGMAEEDEEGWITVTKRGRKPGISRTETVKKNIFGKEKLKRSRKELKNFYTFQIRESKMKQLEKLRKKFEEDKKKISALKQTRRFKPF